MDGVEESHMSDVDTDTNDIFVDDTAGDEIHDNQSNSLPEYGSDSYDPTEHGLFMKIPVVKDMSDDNYHISPICNVRPNGNISYGRLGSAMCPGKRTSNWDRNLMDDLLAIKTLGYKHIICLLQWYELEYLSINDYQEKANSLDLILYHFPIKDRSIPRMKHTKTLVKKIAELLNRGESVLVHCRAGMGRAGMICSCLLTHYGLFPESAIDYVRKQRPGSVQTKEQVRFVYYYAREIGCL